MRLTESDRDSALSVSPDSQPEAGPSSSAAGPSNGYKAAVAKTNGFSQPYTNGVSKLASSGLLDGIAPEKHRSSVAKVSIPGRTLYDDSFVDREEFVRLVIQSLRDVGYTESATTLEAESGYIMETPEVAEFRRCILTASWDSAEAALMRLGVTEGEGLWEAKFLIAKQKYLESLEAGKTTAALHVLRNELAPLNPELDHLHALSALMMCSDPADLRQQIGWDGAAGTSRRRLLTELQRYIPSSVMIPQRRIATLLEQARAYQQSQCLYHNTPLTNWSYSLYTDHSCDRNTFPRVTTAVLQVHSDEVWNLEWSHSGRYLATASKDKTAIIWRIELDKDARSRAYSPEFVLRDHPYPVGCVAWSLDDSILLTAAEHFIRLWNTRTGDCTRVLNQHTDVVTALAWLPDGSGFISGGLDRKIILWDADGKMRDKWERTPIRVTDLIVTPDFTRLVAVGMYDMPSIQPGSNPQESVTPAGSGQAQNAAANANKSSSETRIIIYDLHTKQAETYIRLDGELTSVKISQDSQYALINRASENGPPAEIHLLDLASEQVVRKYSGHSQSKHVIRSCFGGVEGNFVVSGSEDGNVYIWHRDTGALLEVLEGHGEGSVNSVAWNPVNERMFASCSDDKTIRIWEAPPSEVQSSLLVADEPCDMHEADHELENGKDKGKGRWDAGAGPSRSSTASASVGAEPSTSGRGVDPEGGPGYGLGSTTALF
ncbi:WD40 repeat-like protein [Dichomitus squalens LYAD-421 SS1]|uniref:WD40 repeat-like protein n=1 Tax=Dichomitus squalens (strain LYAD-421) TaxID=732165 RepID=UPI000441095D|nr:WD40 repeat-like protein [Dichomitus squalens LYAD-421 SS1]EJF66274.1 WD40 repeat-like protein [Dichomitus squalens LYAD-421 SS1]